MNFVRRICIPERIKGKRVLEIGSYNVNGSPKDIVSPLGPSEYIGVDLQEQDGHVDWVLDAAAAAVHFGHNSFDVVISTEMLEHAEKWEEAIDAMKSVLKPGGLLILTARGPGFPIHAYPSDYWRFTTDDIAATFHDFVTIYLSDDEPQSPGFLYAGYKPPSGLSANPLPIVIPYHSAEAFHHRMADRRSLPDGCLPTPFQAFYHIACMGNWKEVVTEQCEIFERMKLLPMAHVIGTAQDLEWLEGRSINVLSTSNSFTDYETPTLQHLWEWCAKHPSGAALYTHTKGVSAPQDGNKRAWRQLMSHYVTEKWYENLAKLQIADILGINWQQSKQFPHFSGNFWMARADWINSLKSPIEYRNQGGPVVAGNPWERMHAELWLGSEPWHHVANLCCQDVTLWRGPEVFELLEQAKYSLDER